MASALSCAACSMRGASPARLVSVLFAVPSDASASGRAFKSNSPSSAVMAKLKYGGIDAGVSDDDDASGTAGALESKSSLLIPFGPSASAFASGKLSSIPFRPAFPS